MHALTHRSCASARLAAAHRCRSKQLTRQQHQHHTTPTATRSSSSSRHTPATRTVQQRQRQAVCRAAASASGTPNYGIFICSGSPEVTEAVTAAGVPWICLDAQHGAVGYERLKTLLLAARGTQTKTIVRVGGPSDRFGIQQALDLGADGVMVPLINSKEDAQQAVSYCLYPPLGQRSVAGDIGAVYKRGVGMSVLSQYLQEANQKVEVWLQVETKPCFEAIDEVLSVPGITCAFLGPADIGFSFGLHVAQQYDLAAMMASPDMMSVYNGVLQACQKHGVQPGVFCLGEERAQDLAHMGYTQIAYNTDLSCLVNYCISSTTKLQGTNFSI